MSKRLFVGNLAFQTTDDDLRGTFQGFGPVSDVKVVTDRETGRSRGFAFVEMSTEDDARKATEALNGKALDGRTLRVAEAEERRGPASGGSFSGSGGGARRSGGPGNRW
jgi:RNA recognition motif-containing protein